MLFVVLENINKKKTINSPVTTPIKKIARLVWVYTQEAVESIPMCA